MNSNCKLIDKSGLLVTKQAVLDGISKTDLYQYIRENELNQVGHGIYAEKESWADDLYILHLRCPMAVFSHDEALYHYELVDREPIQHTLTIYSGYGTQRLKQSGVKVFTVKKELLDIGRVTVKTSLGHEIPMYDLERTMVDLFRSKSYFEIQDFQTALKGYSCIKSKDLNLLMKYAKLFNLDKKIREYMEVLL
jgi:predicted transcriptional regulator of viral defense system